MPSHLRTAALALIALGAFAIAPAPAADPSADRQAFRDIYRELVEINTTDSVGDSVRAAEAMAARLRAGGLPAEDIRVLSSGPRKGNLVARLRGTGARRPLLLLAHLDVVEAKREDWDSDPFKLIEVDGYFRARGAIDDKAMAAIFVANLIEYVRAGYRPERDIILALTADEELSDSPHNGVRWLLTHHRDLIDAEFALNEGGGGALRNGAPFRLAVQLTEKVYQTYLLEVTDRGGHSATPRRDNPIYRLSEALQRIAAFEFPPRLNLVTRGFFERMAASETPPTADAIKALLAGSTDPAALAPLASRPDYNAQIRTTCVATMLEAGHAENALPQTARATVNCRVMPEESIEEVGRTLARVIADEKVAVIPKGTAVQSPPSAINPEVMQTIRQLSLEMWPGVPLNAAMSAGYTDGRWLRNAGIPVYGVSGLFSDPGNNGVHGRNEQVSIKALDDSKDFLYRLVQRLAGPPKSTP
jgi:acetylornithine deacetylase/succinyl-diaminopimelate desuccinylase-like protein